MSIHEEFIPYNTKVLDSKNRITLGPDKGEMRNVQSEGSENALFIQRIISILLNKGFGQWRWGGKTGCLWAVKMAGGQRRCF
jgi:hypothetical protein